MRYFEKSKLRGGRKSEGFTLIELIIVVVILAVLIGVTIGGIYSYVVRARKVVDLQTARAIVDAQSLVKVTKGMQGDGHSHMFFADPSIKHELGDGADSPDFCQRVMSNFNEYPVSKFDKSLMFIIVYVCDSDGFNPRIVKIYLGNSINFNKYELYPNVCKEFQVE